MKSAVVEAGNNGGSGGSKSPKKVVHHVSNKADLVEERGKGSGKAKNQTSESYQGGYDSDSPNEEDIVSRLSLS